MKHNDLANAIRILSADMVEKAKSGHPGMALGIADILTVLFRNFLNVNPKNTTWSDRDRFILSAGHGSAALYSVMYLMGYTDMTLEQLKNFRQMNSLTPGHPELGLTPGVETTTGPLGQGLANAVGMALAERMLNDEFGDDLVNHYTYALIGDGCLMEGISLEAVALAGHLRLNKLIVLWDNNSISIDGPTNITMTGDHLGRFRDFDWNILEIDGHDPDQITGALTIARHSSRPTFISCRTTIAYGCPTKAGSEASHGAPLGEAEIVGLRKNLGWVYEEPFFVPDDILNEWKNKKHTNDEWNIRFNSLNSDESVNFIKRINGELPNDWQNIINGFKKQAISEKYKVATRKSSGMVLESLTEIIPGLVSGSADLSASVFTKTKKTKTLSKDDYSGRYIHYGAREHAMSAIMNGIALHGGFIPFSGTFLIFADYMKAGMRMSALMEQRVIYVLTHDSIGLGEDGPTHQPVETLAMLRAMPNINVFRPCDPVEVAECWELALLNNSGPSVLSLTRQNVPTLRSAYDSENLCQYGAYIISDTSKEPDVVLIATGSEVCIAVEAQKKLENYGISARVVSMPCWELFDIQSAVYKEYVMPKNVLKVAIEAANDFGWDRYIGNDGIFIGMKNTFGKSAPFEHLYDYFGITSDNIVSGIKNTK